MIYITTEDLQMVQKTSALIWKYLEQFTGKEREEAESFCRYAAKLNQRYEEDKEKHRERMTKYRKDPKTADKVREYAREAQRRHRAKKKAVQPAE